MLLRCCWVPISIVKIRQFAYLLYLCLCLDLDIFMSYLCDLFFFFFSIFIMINRIISWIQTHWFLCLYFRVPPIIFGWLHEWRIWMAQKFSLMVLLSFCLFFANFSLELLIKVLLIKKGVYSTLVTWMSKKSSVDQSEFEK